MINRSEEYTLRMKMLVIVWLALVVKVKYWNGQRMKIYTLDEVDKMSKQRKKAIAKAIWGI